MLATLVTASGEAHGLINTISNSVKDNGFKNFTPANKAKIEAEKKEDSRIVECEYLCSRGRHERLIKHFCRYPGDPIQTWKFIPGRSYKIPLGLAKEVNEAHNRSKRRSGLLSVDGENISKEGAPLEKDETADWIHKFVATGL